MGPNAQYYQRHRKNARNYTTVTRFEHVIFGVMGDNFQHFLLVHMLLQTKELHNRRPWALLFNDDRTCAIYCCCGGLENYVLTFDTIEGACAVRLPPLKLTSCCLEYALRHWAWLTSPTISKKYRAVLAQFRCGILPLKVETGRFSNIPLARHLCEFCLSKAIED